MIGVTNHTLHLRAEKNLTFKNPCIALKNMSALMSMYALNGIIKLVAQDRKLDQPNISLVPYRFARKPPGIWVIQYNQ